MSRRRDIATVVLVGIALGLVMGWALGFTHGSSPPTADNASPPPDAFDYPFGIFVGLAVATISRFVLWPLWHSYRVKRTSR